MKNPLIEFITKAGTIVRINITAITSIRQRNGYTKIVVQGSDNYDLNVHDIAGQYSIICEKIDSWYSQPDV